MDYDIKISGGTVFDGLGTEGIVADVAVKDGVIVAIGDCPGEAAEIIDASGHIVTPGFVDIHTHYDGQVSWDDKLEPSCLHGVTTVVMGSCGVGFAPCRTEDHDRLIRLMEGVEDIPGTALAEGLTWEWESFSEYMESIDFPHAIDFAAQVVHDPLRVYVMGERAEADEQATPEDIAEMRRLTLEAMEAGAVGFSTGRSDVHRTADGHWTPASEAAVEELSGIASAFKDLDHGVLQIVNDFNLERDGDTFDEEFDIIEAFVGAGGGKPFSISLNQRDFAPKQWRRIIDRVEKASDKGIEMHMQVAPRGIGVISGLQCTFHPFIGHPSYKKIADLPLAERVAAMRDPAFKDQILAEKPDKLAGDGTSIPPLVDLVIGMIDMLAFKMFILGDDPDYEQPATNSIGAMAQAEGISALSKLYDVMLLDEGQQFIYFPVYNYTDFNLDAVFEMLQHPRSIMGLSDGGAHVATICDASFPTFLITHWTRDRIKAGKPGLSLAAAIKKLTSETANFVGMRDRGRIQVGAKADLNVIDHASLSIDAPVMIHDLPAGGQRLMRYSHGYRATIVSGQVIVRDSKLTDARPGRLVRLGQQTAKLAAE